MTLLFLGSVLRNATPGVGSITYDDGYDMARHAPEIKTAQWLHDNLGGDIVLLNEINEDKVKTPDFLWKEKYWELKCISSEKAADSALRSALKQIHENPGGVILDCENNSLSENQLQKILATRLERSGTIDTDVLVLYKGELAKALRHTKK